jgi:hypothetical protein
VIQVRNSESGGAASNFALPQMRVHLCNMTATPVLDRPNGVPKFTLAAPYPNPVAGTATIDFSLDRAEPVSIHVYDVAGRRVATIMENQSRGVGPGSVSFDAKDLASGVYFLKMQTPTKNVARKITVLNKHRAADCREARAPVADQPPSLFERGRTGVSNRAAPRSRAVARCG